MPTAEGWFGYGIPLLDRQWHPMLDLEDMSGLGNIHTYNLLMGIILPSYVKALHGFSGIGCFNLVEIAREKYLKRTCPSCSKSLLCPWLSFEFEQWKWVGFLRCAQKKKSHFLKLCDPALPPVKVTSLCISKWGCYWSHRRFVSEITNPEFAANIFLKGFWLWPWNCTSPCKLLGDRLPRCSGVHHLLKAGL